MRRFGAGELVRKPLRVLLAPLIIPRLPPATFVFDGRELPCFYHPYNMTWATERCVEIPVARAYLAAAGPRVLEVGNVLAHYGPVTHDVVDKYERGERVINADVVDFAPASRYDLVLSISTFEHLGFDDEEAGGSGPKILAAIAACRSLLAPAGRLVITVPIGYNPDLDRLIAAQALGATRSIYLARTGRLAWETVGEARALSCRYGSPRPYANAILVAEFAA